MGVTLYNTPAQAQFINTYVPIQFEGLYKIADKAEAEYNTASALQDELFEKYSDVNTISAPDKANYAKIYANTLGRVNEVIQSSEDLKDPTKRAELSSIARKLKGDRTLANIIFNAPVLRDFASKEDPRWQGYEKNKALGWDSSTMGQFSESNLPYANFTDVVAPLASQVKDRIIGKKDRFYDRFGKSVEDIDSKVAAEAGGLVSNPILRRQAEIQLRSTGKEFTQADIDNVVLNNSSNVARGFAWETIQPNQIGLEMWKMGEQQKMHRETLAARKKEQEVGYPLRSQQIRNHAQNTVASNKINFLLNKVAKLDVEGKLRVNGKVYLNSIPKEMRSTVYDLYKDRKEYNYLSEKSNLDENEKSKLSKLTERISNGQSTVLAMFSDAEARVYNYDKLPSSEQKKQENKLTIPKSVIAGLANIDLDQYDVENWYNTTRGKKVSIKLSNGTNLDAWTSRQTKKLRLIDDKTGIYNNSIGGNKLQEDLNSGILDGIALIAPTTTAKVSTGNRLDLRGYMYIPADVAKKRGYSIENAEKVSTPSTGTSQNKVPGDVFYKIPVADEFTEAAESNSASTSAFDATYQKQFNKSYAQNQEVVDIQE